MQWSASAAAAGSRVMLAQRGHLLPWAPVCLGTGIGIYFVLPTEPGFWAWAALGAAGVLTATLAFLWRLSWAALLIGLALVTTGVGAAGLRAWAVAAPVLEFRYHGPVEGRIVEVDRSSSDALRMTLDRVVLEDVAPDQTPDKVRISVGGDQRWLSAEPGRVVLLTAHLVPPPGPSEPGDFDFRRSAWFERLGAVGWTHTPILTAATPQGGLWLHRLRATLSAAVRHRMVGDAGGLAAAVMTGDRSGLSQEANQQLRDSGLYHLVSISGMHMGLLVVFVFGLVRTAVALVPPLALRMNGKKAAAVVALPAATLYLALAGRDVATERAFVMVAVMLGAVLLDRRAVTLRSVAIAATIVLVLRPESLVNPGFQMSFAAVAALSFAFSAPFGGGWGQWRWAAPAAALVLSSLVAGLATAPYAGAHFNRFAAYGLLANLLAVPAMGFLVMPGAVILALGALLGLLQPALLVVELGCRWILLVADLVAGLDGAAWGMTSPPGAVLPLLSGGVLVLILWQGRLRWTGVPIAVGALGLWLAAERPAILIAPSGGVVGVLGPDGRTISRPSGEAFAVSAWLENDGDTVTLEMAAARGGLIHEGERMVRARVDGTEVLVVRGSRALAALEGCGGAELLVTDQDVTADLPCLVLDAGLLGATGAVAGWPDGKSGLRLVGAEDVAGERPWTRTGRDGPPPALGSP
jgi:competence protein ComEC